MIKASCGAGPPLQLACMAAQDGTVAGLASAVGLAGGLDVSDGLAEGLDDALADGDGELREAEPLELPQPATANMAMTAASLTPTGN